MKGVVVPSRERKCRRLILVEGFELGKISTPFDSREIPSEAAVAEFTGNRPLRRSRTIQYKGQLYFYRIQTDIMTVRHGGGVLATLGFGYLVLYITFLLTGGSVYAGEFTELRVIVLFLTWKPGNVFYWLYVASVTIVVLHVGRQRYRRYRARRTNQTRNR